MYLFCFSNLSGKPGLPQYFSALPADYGADLPRSKDTRIIGFQFILQQFFSSGGFEH
jgi:hypothetical protein